MNSHDTNRRGSSWVALTILLFVWLAYHAFTPTPQHVYYVPQDETLYGLNRSTYRGKTPRHTDRFFYMPARQARARKDKTDKQQQDKPDRLRQAQATTPADQELQTPADAGQALTDQIGPSIVRDRYGYIEPQRSLRPPLAERPRYDVLPFDRVGSDREFVDLQADDEDAKAKKTKLALLEQALLEAQLISDDFDNTQALISPTSTGGAGAGSALAPATLLTNTVSAQVFVSPTPTVSQATKAPNVAAIVREVDVPAAVHTAATAAATFASAQRSDRVPVTFDADRDQLTVVPSNKAASNDPLPLIQISQADERSSIPAAQQQWLDDRLARLNELQTSMAPGKSDQSPALAAVPFLEPETPVDEPVSHLPSPALASYAPSHSDEAPPAELIIGFADNVDDDWRQRIADAAQRFNESSGSSAAKWLVASETTSNVTLDVIVNASSSKALGSKLGQTRSAYMTDLSGQQLPLATLAGEYGMPTVIDINSDVNLFTGSDASLIAHDEFDLETIFTHEVGHAMGLGHDESNQNAISFPTLSAGEVRRSFGQDELEQLTELTQLFDRLPWAGGASARSPFSGGFGFRSQALVALPEPATIGLLGLGAAALLTRRRR